MTEHPAQHAQLARGENQYARGVNTNRTELPSRTTSASNSRKRSRFSSPPLIRISISSAACSRRNTRTRNSARLRQRTEQYRCGRPRDPTTNENGSPHQRQLRLRSSVRATRPEESVFASVSVKPGDSDHSKPSGVLNVASSCYAKHFSLTPVTGLAVTIETRMIRGVGAVALGATWAPPPGRVGVRSGTPRAVCFAALMATIPTPGRRAQERSHATPLLGT
jgi:hypothetical protein